jgi:hypothetical protein
MSSPEIPLAGRTVSQTASDWAAQPGWLVVTPTTTVSPEEEGDHDVREVVTVPAAWVTVTTRVADGIGPTDVKVTWPTLDDAVELGAVVSVAACPLAPPAGATVSQAASEAADQLVWLVVGVTWTEVAPAAELHVVRERLMEADGPER